MLLFGSFDYLQNFTIYTIANLFFAIMAHYENFEKYDMFVCFIKSSENPQDATELYLKG